MLSFHVKSSREDVQGALFKHIWQISFLTSAIFALPLTLEEFGIVLKTG